MDRRQGEKLEQLVSGFKGEVYMSDHPWYLGMLGRATQAHRMAVKDLVRSPGFGQWGEILDRIWWLSQRKEVRSVYSGRRRL